MVGLLLITHEPLGAAFRACAAHVFGQVPQGFGVIDVVADEEPGQVIDRALAMMAELEQGKGVLVLSDMLGATPCNIASKLSQHPGSMSLISGVNLPMLLRALSYRQQLALPELVDKALEGGQAAVMAVPCGQASPGAEAG